MSLNCSRKGCFEEKKYLMKKLIIKFGLIGASLIVGVPLLSIAIVGLGPDSFAVGELIGYSTIVIAMLLIIVAQLNYRKEQGGQLSFGDAFKIGLGISTIGGLAFGLYNTVYVLFIDPEFNEKYFAYSMGLERGTPAFQQQYAEALSGNNFMFSIEGQALLMFLTVFLIGFVISIIGGLILQRKGVIKTV